MKYVKPRLEFRNQYRAILKSLSGVSSEVNVPLLEYLPYCEGVIIRAWSDSSHGIIDGLCRQVLLGGWLEKDDVSSRISCRVA